MGAATLMFPGLAVEEVEVVALTCFPWTETTLGGFELVVDAARFFLNARRSLFFAVSVKSPPVPPAIRGPMATPGVRGPPPLFTVSPTNLTLFSSFLMPTNFLSKDAILALEATLEGAVAEVETVAAELRIADR